MTTQLTCLWRGVLCGLVAAVVVPGVALAQGPGRGGFGGGFGGGFPGQGGGLAGLLQMQEVQTELKLTDAQKPKLRDAREERRGGAARGGGGAGGAEGAPNFRDMSREERQKFMEDARKRMEEQSKKAEEVVKGILNPEQLTRLNELRIQQQGVRAMGRPEVAAALQLTDAQKEAIGDILDAARPQRGPGGGGGFGGNRPSEEERDKARAEAEERNKKAQADIDAVLTETQKAEWVKLQGAKFTFPERPAFGQGGRGGRGGQGGEGAPGGRQNRRQRPARPEPEA